VTYPVTPSGGFDKKKFPAAGSSSTVHDVATQSRSKSRLEQNLAASQGIEAMAKQMVGAIINSILQILTGGAFGGSGTTNGIDLFGNLFNNLFKTLGITDPGGTLATIEQDLYNVEQTLTHWVDNILAPLNLVLDGKTWTKFITDIVGDVEGTATTLSDALKTSIVQAEGAIGQIVSMVTASGQQGFAGFLTQISQMLTSISQLGGGNVIGNVPSDVMHVLDLGSVNQTQQEMTGNGTFLSAAAIDPTATAAGITWDKNNGKTVDGSAKFTASGVTKSLFSNPITVTSGQKLSLSTYVKWASLGVVTGTTTPIELNVAKFLDGALVGYENVARAGGVGSNSTWTELSGVYTVPAGVDRVRMKLTVRGDALTGTVWFDEASMTRTNLLEGSWMNGILNTMSGDLQHLVDQISQAVNGGAGTGQSLTTVFANMQAVFAAIYNAVYPANATTVTAANAQTALQAAWYKMFGYTYVKDTFWGTALPLIDGTKLDPNGSNIPTGVVPDITRDMSQDMQDTIDAIYSTIAGSGSDLTPAQAKQKFQTLMQLLFGQYSAYGKTALWPNAVPTIDGTKIDGGPGAGKVPVNAVPTTDVGKAILPGGGSGGMLVRTNTTPVEATPGRNAIGGSFWSYASVTPSADLYISGGSFVATTSGWYAVEMSFSMNPTANWGWNFAPVLFKDGAPHKVGSDSVGSFWGFGGSGGRYAQGSFFVYIEAGHSVSAGYDFTIGPNLGTNVIKADSSGVETYFGVTLLSKSYT